MAKTDAEIHQECLNRFIDLSNEIKEGGVDVKLVSSALMSASAVYETFSQVGNTGGLTPSGVDKVSEKYKKHVEQYQQMRKAEDDRRRAAANSDS